MMRNLTHRLGHVVVMAIAALLAFGAVAFAADQVTPSDGSLLDLLKPVYEAFAGGHYAYAAALLVILLAALAKRYLGDLWKNSSGMGFLHTDLGGTLLALVASMATAMSAALAAPGAHITLAMLWSSLLIGVGAAGGFAVLKNLVFEPVLKPLEAWLEKKWPFLTPVIGVISWIFDKPNPVTQAEAAGSAAVAANPAPGVTADAGNVTELK
jgi:hypothetical protein